MMRKDELSLILDFLQGDFRFPFSFSRGVRLWLLGKFLDISRDGTE